MLQRATSSHRSCERKGLMPALRQVLLRFIYWVDAVALLLRVFGLSFRHNQGSIGSTVVRRFSHPRLSTEL